MRTTGRLVVLGVLWLATMAAGQAAEPMRLTATTRPTAWPWQDSTRVANRIASQLDPDGIPTTMSILNWLMFKTWPASATEFRGPGDLAIELRRPMTLPPAKPEARSLSVEMSQAIIAQARLPRASDYPSSPPEWQLTLRDAVETVSSSPLQVVLDSIAATKFYRPPPSSAGVWFGPPDPLSPHLIMQLTITEPASLLPSKEPLSLEPFAVRR